MLSRHSPRRGRGVTFIEIMVVILIMTSMTLMATGLFPGVIQYFRARRSMEGLLWDLRKVQQRARSRGNSVGAAFGGIFGLKFYAGSMGWTGATLAVQPQGFSYLVYGPATVVPADTLGALSQQDSAQVVNLDSSLIPVDVGAPNAPPRALPIRIQFNPDVSNGRADVVPDDTLPMGPTAACPACPNFLDFRLQDSDGYFRIQFENQRFIGLRYVDL